MSQSLMDFVQNFLDNPRDCSMFCNQYIQRWKDERDRGELLLDDSKTSEALSSIFCLADLFNPDGDREEYELDEQSLCVEIQKVLRDTLIYSLTEGSMEPPVCENRSTES